MKIVEKANTYGGTILASMHIDESTEISIGDGTEKGVSVVRIGDLTIFASDADFTILASAIGDHIRSKHMRPVL